MKMKIFSLFLIFGFFVNLPQVLAVENASRKVLLIAGHGAGKDCNHASYSINGKMYYENIETRRLVDRIASYLSEAKINYEIANEIVGDAYWDKDPAVREAARNCSNPNVNSCCGFKTATIGTFGPTLMDHIDHTGIQNYALALEIHFNASKGKYTAVLARDAGPKEISEKIGQAVVDAIGYGYVLFGIDKDFLGYGLGTITSLYQARSIPTVYLETVFMDNPTQFQAYLNNQDKVAKNIADAISEIAQDAKGGSGGNVIGNTQTQSGFSSGRFVDPYPNLFGKTELNSYETKGCGTLFFDDYGNATELKKILDDIFSFGRILIPVIIILLVTIDYVKAIVSSNADALKKTNQLAIRRAMIGLILFFLPYFLDLLFHLFGLYDMSRCGIGG